MLSIIFNHCAVYGLPFEYIPSRNMVIVKEKGFGVQRFCETFNLDYVVDYDCIKILRVK